MEEKIKTVAARIAEINSGTKKLIEDNNVPSSIRNEFHLKSNQYDGMIEDLETMRSFTDKQETLENLLNQEVEVLRVRIEWEKDILRRAMKYVK